MLISYLWSSPHTPNEEQLESLTSTGLEVKYLKDVNPGIYNQLVSIAMDTDLTFLAQELVDLCAEESFILVQPGGSPAFQCKLGMLIRDGNTIICDVKYAFSERISEDILQPDGSVKKVSIFKHQGWVSV